MFGLRLGPTTSATREGYICAPTRAVYCSNLPVGITPADLEPSFHDCGSGYFHPACPGHMVDAGEVAGYGEASAPTKLNTTNGTGESPVAAVLQRNISPNTTQYSYTTSPNCAVTFHRTLPS